jgi:hypothetical protein
MASGHAYRVNRPNTWLLRPMLQSEDSSCQSGAVHTWPIASLMRCRCMSADKGGRLQPGASSAACYPDPKIGWALRGCLHDWRPR